MSSKETDITSSAMFTETEVNSEHNLTSKPDIEISELTEELEHVNNREDDPIDALRATVCTVDNPSLPVFTYVIIK